MHNETYTIKLPIFEGPFDLLLHLLRINEMDINDVSVSAITQQYLDYIHTMRALDLELAGEFLVMASTLLNIKSRLLIPTYDNSEKAEPDEDNSLTADALVQQLIEYRKYKEASVFLKEREEQMSQLQFRSNPEVLMPQPTQEELTCEVSLLLKAFAKVISIVETPDYNPDIFEPYTVQDKIQYIEQLCSINNKTVSLSDIFHRCFNRMEIVTTFLAVLELTRLKKVIITQDKIFDDVYVQLSDEDEQDPVEPLENDNLSAKENDTDDRQ